MDIAAEGTSIHLGAGIHQAHNTSGDSLVGQVDVRIDQSALLNLRAQRERTRNASEMSVETAVVCDYGIVNHHVADGAMLRCIGCGRDLVGNETVVVGASCDKGRLVETQVFHHRLVLQLREQAATVQDKVADHMVLSVYRATERPVNTRKGLSEEVQIRHHTIRRSESVLHKTEITGRGDEVGISLRTCTREGVERHVHEDGGILPCAVIVINNRKNRFCILIQKRNLHQIAQFFIRLHLQQAVTLAIHDIEDLLRGAGARLHGTLDEEHVFLVFVGIEQIGVKHAGVDIHLRQTHVFAQIDFVEAVERAVRIDPCNGMIYIVFVVHVSVGNGNGIAVGIPVLAAVKRRRDSVTVVVGRQTQHLLAGRQIDKAESGFRIRFIEQAVLLFLSFDVRQPHDIVRVLGNGFQPVTAQVIYIIRCLEIVGRVLIVVKRYDVRRVGFRKEIESDVVVVAQASDIGESVEIALLLVAGDKRGRHGIELAVEQCENQVVVGLHHRLLVPRHIRVEEGLLVAGGDVAQLSVVRIHHDRHRTVSRTGNEIVIHLKGMLLLRQRRPARLGIDVKEDGIVHIIIVFRFRINDGVALENHYIVLRPLVHGIVMRQHLVAGNHADFLRTVLFQREDVVVVAARKVLGDRMVEEHHLAIVVGIEELLCYQSVQLHIVHARDEGIQVRDVCERVCELAHQFLLAVEDLHIHRLIPLFSRSERNIHGIGPCGAVGTVEIAEDMACRHSVRCQRRRSARGIAHVLHLRRHILLPLQQTFVVRFRRKKRVCATGRRLRPHTRIARNRTQRQQKHTRQKEKSFHTHVLFY